MSPDESVERLQPLLDRVYLGHCALIEGDSAPAAVSRPLTAAKVEQHCKPGSAVRYGVYPIEPGSSTVRCAVLDLDSHKGETSMSKMVEVARDIERVADLDFGLAAHAFRSSGGRGIHLIFLWDEPQDAYSVRRELIGILAELGLKNGTKGVAAGQVEVFPKQDEVPADGWGNMFVLPLARKSVRLDPVTWEPLERGDPGEWRMSTPVAKRDRPEPVHWEPVTTELGQLAEMLEAIPNTGPDYDLYIKVLMGVHHATGGSREGLEMVEACWLSRWEGNDPAMNLKKWESFGRRTDGPMVTVNSLQLLAEQHGWVDPAIAARFSVIEDDEDDSGGAATATSSALVIPKGYPPSVRVERNKAGQILPTADAVQVFIRHGGITRMQIRYDEFLARLVRIDEEVGMRPIEDEDYTLIRVRLERDGGFKDIPDGLIRSAARLIGKYQRMDSARQWIESLPAWDGTPRIERFYTTYLGCEDGPYSRSLGLYQWTALAGRVMDPGCQLDITPIWVGAQGCGKTTSVRALSPHRDFFGSIDLGLKDADFSRRVRGKLVGEIGELRGMYGREREAVKDLMTRTHEEWVEKFIEHATVYPRRLLMIATTNDDGILDDPTGNRRYAPVRVGHCDARRIAEDRDQLWAEGLDRWRAGGVMWEDVAGEAAVVHAQFERSDPWQDRVEKWLEDKGPVTATMVLEDALYIAPKDQDRGKTMRVTEVLKRLGRSRKQCMINGVKAVWWFPTPDFQT